MVKDGQKNAMYVGVFPHLTNNPKCEDLFVYLTTSAFVNTFPNLRVFDVPDQNVKAIAIKYSCTNKDGSLEVGKLMRLNALQQQYEQELNNLLEKFSLKDALPQQIFKHKVLEGDDGAKFTYF